MTRYLLDIYRRRDLILYLVTSNLKAQHRNSMLGYLWWLLDPLLGVLLYYFVVVHVFGRGGDDYGPFLVIGMVVWRWVSATTTAATQSIVRQAAIITHVQLPKIIFPLTETLTGLCHFGFGLIVIIALFLAWGIRPTVTVVWLPWIVLSQFLFLLALSTALAYYGVFVRDLVDMMNHILRVWFFASPVIWLPEMLPESARWVTAANPMTYLLHAYRDVLVRHQNPALTPLAIIAVASAAAIGCVTVLYSRREHRLIRAL